MRYLKKAVKIALSMETGRNPGGALIHFAVDKNRVLKQKFKPNTVPKNALFKKAEKSPSQRGRSLGATQVAHQHSLQ